MNEETKNEIRELKGYASETPLNRINMLLEMIKEEVGRTKEDKNRLLLKIVDHASPQRSRREDIEKKLDVLLMEDDLTNP